MSVRVGGAARYSQVSFASSTTEIQALLNGGQKEIILGEGTYIVDAALTIPAGVTLRGDGPQASIISYNSGVSIPALLIMAAAARVSGIQLTRTGGGGITFGVQTAGNDVVIADMLCNLMGINLANACCRAEKNRITGASEGIVVTGTLNQIVRNVIKSCIRGIHLSAGLNNLIESNDIVGDATSTRGIHAEGAADFNKVLHNTIKDILDASPGRGIDWPATGASNLIGGNIFSGTFGAKAIVAGAGVPVTTQFVQNHTVGVSPAGARLVIADLGGAAGISNT